MFRAELQRLRLSQFRERGFDPREDRGLSELRKYPLCLGQVLKCKRTSFLSFAKQAKKQVCMANVMSRRIEIEDFPAHEPSRRE